MKIPSIQLFTTYFFLIHSTSGQCPLNCFCLDSSVTCTGLKSIPPIFPEDTRYLTISEIEVEQIPAGVFNRLPLLESIEIYDGNVGKISSDAFQSLSLLEFITLSELTIGTIESYAFNNITDIGSLSLDMSTINLIQPYAFFDMFAVDQIEVSSNEVKYIDSFAFSAIDELLEFSFQSNQVKTIKPYAFSQFSNLYEFSMYLNTIGDIGCGSFEPLLYQTEEQSFYSNKFNCTCNIVWISSNPSLKKFLFSSLCQLPGTEENINWDKASLETLHCIYSDKYLCLSSEYFERLIPNVRKTSKPEISTRPSSSTMSPQTPSNSKHFQEDWSEGQMVTLTKTSAEVQAETISRKKTNKLFVSSSTFEQKTKTTTKTSTNKPSTTVTPAVDVNTDSTKSLILRAYPNIVITKKTAKVKPENNTDERKRSHEPVSAVLKESEGNGAKVNTLCWFGMNTVFAFTLIREMTF